MEDQLPDLQEATIHELQAGLTANHFTSLDLVKVRVIGTLERPVWAISSA